MCHNAEETPAPIQTGPATSAHHAAGFRRARLWGMADHGRSVRHGAGGREARSVAGGERIRGQGPCQFFSPRGTRPPARWCPRSSPSSASTSTSWSGGGHFPASPAGVELVTLKIDGAVVRSATGENDERLRWETWDVSEYGGRHGDDRNRGFAAVPGRPHPGGSDRDVRREAPEAARRLQPDARFRQAWRSRSRERPMSGPCRTRETGSRLR